MILTVDMQIMTSRAKPVVAEQLRSKEVKRSLRHDPDWRTEAIQASSNYSFFLLAAYTVRHWWPEPSDSLSDFALSFLLFFRLGRFSFRRTRSKDESGHAGFEKLEIPQFARRAGSEYEHRRCENNEPRRTSTVLYCVWTPPYCTVVELTVMLLSNGTASSLRTCWD